MLQIEGLLEDDNRYSMQVAPRYEISPDETWLRVVLTDETSATYYEVAHHLLVGLAHGTITDIYLLDIEFL